MTCGSALCALIIRAAACTLAHARATGQPHVGIFRSGCPNFWAKFDSLHGPHAHIVEADYGCRFGDSKNSLVIAWVCPTANNGRPGFRQLQCSQLPPNVLDWAFKDVASLPLITVSVHARQTFQACICKLPWCCQGQRFQNHLTSFVSR